ncbi:MAG: division/cell wall cluster transcriptional repressor MraZ [Gammaproteobacteria bacterium]|nr:division/cell wall cluster transcriptional repressor MraZ [Gammaproteobacteria bacterium]NCF83307.1 division/cell wall cluster transcriptional repressor MraZ [Pseudomonadota bacterium]
MFRGEYSLSLDAKGRLAIPSRYRERLVEDCGGKLIVTISLLERCLVVYPYPRWQRIEDELKDLPALDQQAQAINHLLIGHAVDCDMDSNGRVLLSQALRKFAGLDKRIMMVGQVDKFEIWDDGGWNRRRDELLDGVPQLHQEPSDALRKLVL